MRRGAGGGPNKENNYPGGGGGPNSIRPEIAHDDKSVSSIAGGGGAYYEVPSIPFKMDPTKQRGPQLKSYDTAALNRLPPNQHQQQQQFF